MNQPAVKADLDPQETAEWLEAFEGVTDIDGRERAHFLLERMAEADQRKHGDFFSMVTTPYVNTIPAYKQPTYPGDLAAEARINAFIR
ncbi:hypothetical protein V6E69_25150, partial [Serratia marcescens]